MKNKDALLQAAETWYKGASVRDLLSKMLAPTEEVYAWYEASRTQQLDGTFIGKYYICTVSKLFVLAVTAMQIDLRAYPISALQKVYARIPYYPGHNPNWPQSEWSCRFQVGSDVEIVKINFPENADQVPAYLSLLQALLSGRKGT